MRCGFFAEFVQNEAMATPRGFDAHRDKVAGPSFRQGVNA